MIRVRVRERLSATPGHVIGQGPAPGGGVVPCGGGGGGGECTFLRYYDFLVKKGHFLVNKVTFLNNCHSGALKGARNSKTKSAYQNPAPIGRKKVTFFNNCHSGALKGAKKSKKQICVSKSRPHRS